MNRNAIVGGVLMVVGTAMLLPGLAPQTGQIATLALLPGAALLTYGTYLLGTSERGRAV